MNATTYTRTERDDYRRTVTRTFSTETGRVLAAVVTIPARTAHLFPGRYMVTNFQTAKPETEHFAKRADALARMAELTR